MALAPKKVLVGFVSTTVAICIAVAFLESREAPTVVLVDVRGEVGSILEQRMAELKTSALDADSVSSTDLGSELVKRSPLSVEVSEAFFPQLKNLKDGFRIRDEHAFYWERSFFKGKVDFKEHPDGGWKVATNNMGFRKSVNVLRDRPKLRIIATGDSHTAGLVPNHEQFINLLEANLKQATPGRSVECLNGGKGGYSFYNYIGVLEKVLPLKPDVFVMAVFGGNDFNGVINLFRYYEGLERGKNERVYSFEDFEKLRGRFPMYYAQEFSQMGLLARNQTLKRYAQEGACLLTAAIKQICDQNGIRLICVYIPGGTTAQPQYFEKKVNAVMDHLGRSAFEPNPTEQVADGYLAFLREQGIECIDMRETFRASPDPCYWKTDLHLNTEGHRLIAERLQVEFPE